MNFIFECSTRYLTSERSKQVRYRVEHEKIKFISTSGHAIFCLSYILWKRCDLLCNHDDVDLFTCEDNMLFSRVKITRDYGYLHNIIYLEAGFSYTHQSNLILSYHGSSEGWNSEIIRLSIMWFNAHLR